VDQLKKAVLFLGEKTKGVLVAPSITNAAMKELEKANLRFEPMEAVERGLRKGTSGSLS
jgi:RecB family endonuclease NucS